MNSTDLFPGFEFLSQAQLADVFGTASEVIGHSLTALGLRTGGGTPTKKARDSGIVVMVTKGNMKFPAWHKNILIKVLERFGHRRVEATGPEDIPQSSKDVITLRGPFTVRPCGDTHGAILNGDGTCCLWGMGRANLEKVVKLLTLAVKCKMLPTATLLPKEDPP